MSIRNVAWFILTQIAFLPICQAANQSNISPHSGSENQRYFLHLPSLEADEAFRLFLEMVDVPLIYAVEDIQGLRLNAIEGQLSAFEAVESLIADTPLSATRDPGTGTIIIRRVSTTSEHGTSGQLQAGDTKNPEINQMNTKPAKDKKLLTTLFAFLVAVVNPANAQTESDDSDVYDLSPFVIDTSKDSGYTATNTLSGSRLNQSLQNTPASISVLTLEFLEDIGATNINEAISYGLNTDIDIGGGASNVGASTGNGLVGNEYNIQIRGYRNAVATRDYFPTTLASDSFNIERIEVARGPNSMIFGVGGPGGIVNTTVKSAILGNNATHLTLRTGSWSEQRASLDLNRAFLDRKLAIRFNGLLQSADGWKDFARDDQKRGALALTARPFEKTEIRIHTEFGELEQNRVRPWNAVDQISSWVDQGRYFVNFGTPESPWSADDETYAQQRSFAGSPSNGLVNTPPEGQTFERRTAHLGTPTIYLTDGPLANKLVWVGTRGEGKRYYRTSFHNNTAGYNTPQFIDDESIMPRTANPTGPGAVNFTDYHVLHASVDQKIGSNLNINLTAQSIQADRRNQAPMLFAEIAYKLDVTSMLPSFTTDGNFDATEGGPETTGQGVGALNLNSPITNPFVGTPIINYVPTYSLRDDDQEDIRLSASYNLDLGKAGNHSIVGFVSRSTTTNENQSFREANVSPDRPDVNYFSGNNFGGRATHIDYFSSDLDQRGVPDPFKNPLSDSVFYGNPQYRFSGGFVRNNWTRGETEIDSAALAIQSTFLSESLITTLGVRRDEVSIENSGRINDPNGTGEAIGLADSLAPQEESGDTYTVGLVYHLPWVEGLSIYANKSTNFQPQAGAQAFEDESLRAGREIGALKGVGEDIGLKFRLFDGRVHANLGYFSVAQENASTGFDGRFTSYISAIWTTILNGGSETILTDQNDPNGHRAGGRDTRAQSSDGWEFELTANPTDNWRISFNVSKTDNAVSDLGTHLNSYIKKHRSEWEQWRSTPYDTSRSPGFLGNNTVGDLIDGLDNLMAVVKAGEGVTETNIRPWNANLFTAYTFSDGPIRGLTIGGGVKYRGDAVLGVNPATLENPKAQIFKGNSYYLANAMLAYEFEMKGIPVRLQLNVDNLLENNDKQVLASNYNTTTGQLEPFYYFLEPRSYSLSARFSF